MCQTSVFCWVVIRTGSYRNISLDTWLVFILSQIHFHSVRQSVNPGVGRIVFNYFISVVVAVCFLNRFLSPKSGGQKHTTQKGQLFYHLLLKLKVLVKYNRMN